MWDDMDRLGQPAFHERASKVGSSAVPAHLFHDFPRHGHNMRSWSWIGQFLNSMMNLMFGNLGQLEISLEKYPGSILFWAFILRGGYLCRRWSRFGGLLNQDRHVSILFGLDISQATWLREHLRDLIPLYPSELSRLTSKSTRSFSEFGETRAPWLVA